MATTNNSDAGSRWTTSLGLLQDLKSGEESGWVRFVDLYTPLIFYWARRAGLQEADAADICQGVFRSVSAGIDGLSYDRPEHNFRGWLWTITRNELSRYFGRQEKTQMAVGGTDALRLMAEAPDWIDDEEAPDAPHAEAEVMRRAAEAIRGDFEEQTWQAFWLSAVEEMLAPDVAVKLGISANAVRQAKFRVVRRLKEYLGF